MLSNHRTQLIFNDFTSKTISITNSATQGCPLSMLIYTFYNADLINIAKGKEELSTGFVDDCTLIAVSTILMDTHLTLKHMMERSGGGLEWSRDYNLPFELMKLAYMDFP